MIKSRFGNWLRATVLVLMAGTLVETISSAVAEARAGGGRSMGRSSRPSPSSNGFQSPPNRSPQMSPPLSANRGGFMQGLAGGLAGGLLGSMLFSSIGNASGLGGGGLGGGGIGFVEILLFAGLAYLGFRWWKSRQQPAFAYSGGDPSRNSFGGFANSQQAPALGLNQGEVASSIDTEEASDFFFKIQAAWTRRDLTPMRDLIGAPLLQTLSSDLDALKEKKQFNKLENISIRRAEVLNSWYEEGKSYSTVRLTANLLDYTIEEGSMRVLEGSDSIPVKFEEDWTFARQNHDRWQLVGIQQV